MALACRSIRSLTSNFNPLVIPCINSYRFYSASAATAAEHTASGVSTEPISKRDDLPYRLKAATIVYRIPVITPDKPDWLVRFDEFSEQKYKERFQRSAEDIKKQMREQQSKRERKKSDKAERSEKEKEEKANARNTVGVTLEDTSREEEAEEEQRKQRAARARATGSSREDGEQTNTQDVGSNPDQAPPAGYLWGPRVTSADISGERHSLHRALQKRLYLIIKRASTVSGDDPRTLTDSEGLPLWCFPHGDWNEGESIRMTAHRNFRNIIGKSMRVYYFGNAPSGHHTFDAPSSDITKPCNLFLFQARLLTGEPRLRRAEFDDFAWVTRDELADYLPSQFHQKVWSVLWD